MPELPEVEQVKNSLRPYILGKKIIDIVINVPRLIKSPTPELFIQELTGRTVTQLDRRGKYLVFTLDNGKLLVIHLRMTGALIYKSAPTEPVDKPRIIFTLSAGILYYCDTRTLGTLDLITPAEIKRIKCLSTLGPEPIGADFTLEYLIKQFQSKKRLLKAALLDQSVIAGLGNIYVDEAMAMAHLHPKRRTDTLSQEQIQALHSAVKQVIDQGIANKGTTFRDYKDADGNQGGNQNFLLVYGKQGQPCKFCGAPLVYEKIAGRGTVYCPRCQLL